MKYLYLSVLSVVLLTACTKRDYGYGEADPYQWMRTHDRGFVAYVDYSTGNYMVETQGGYTVVESFGAPPREYDEVYAYFTNQGMQTIYNRDGNYFSNGRVVDYWLSWSDAMYLLDYLGYNKY